MKRENMGYLRDIRLGLGKGVPGKQACWMTALQSHIGGQWTDECECVDPVINELCILINDAYGPDNERRTQDILDFGLFRVLGTKGTKEDSVKRCKHALDVVLWDWFYPLEGHRFKKLPDLVTPHGDTQAYLHAIKNKEIVWRFTAINSFLHQASEFSGDPSWIGHAISLVLDEFDTEKARNFIQRKAFPLLAELVEMGPHGPEEMPEPVCGVPEFHRLVGVK